MKEMNILQKEDLPYFEELEKEGKAVILRFDTLEDLMNFDLDSLLKEDGREPTIDEIQVWMDQEKKRLQEQGKKAQSQKKLILDQEQQITLLKKLQTCALPEEDKALVIRAIELKLSYESILELLKPEIDHEQRQRIIREQR